MCIRDRLGIEHASQFSTNQSIVAEFIRALCFQATNRLICKKVCFKRSRKFQVKGRFHRPRRLLPGSVGFSFNVYMYWYVMKNLMCRMCSLCSCEDSQGYWFEQKQSYKLLMSYFPKLYLATLWAYPFWASQFAGLACCCYLSPKFWIGLDYNTTVVNCLYSRNDFDYSVIHTWGTDKSKAVTGGVTISQTWREHLPENGSWIIIG